MEHIKAGNVIIRETPNSPSLAFALLIRYLDMISRELEQRERNAEEQHLLQMDREERRQREDTRRKLNLRRKIEEVRDKHKTFREKLCTVVSFVNNFCCLPCFLIKNY